MRWTYLDKGIYNNVYRNDNGTLVLKIPYGPPEDSDAPQRAVRLWNEINGDLSPKASVYTFENQQGWVCPFIHGRFSTDQEISDKLIDVFNQTGRIILDAATPKNCITQKNGKVVFIDIGMAVLLEPRLGNNLRRSQDSDNIWDKYKEDYSAYFERCSEIAPITVRTIQALLFIKQNRPTYKEASFLSRNLELITIFASAYANTYQFEKALIKLDTAYKEYQQETLKQGASRIQLNNSFFRENPSPSMLRPAKITPIMAADSAELSEDDSVESFDDIPEQPHPISTLFRRLMCRKSHASYEDDYNNEDNESQTATL